MSLSRRRLTGSQRPRALKPERIQSPPARARTEKPDLTAPETQILVTRYRVALIREPDPDTSSELLSRPSAAARFFWKRLQDAPQEVMLAAYLDVHNRLIGWQQAFTGTLTAAKVEPRPLLQAALLANACAMVVGHNHPSGDPTPSGQDVLMTRRLAEAGEIVGVQLLDHVIVGERGRWVSLRERGAW
jgi:DNA repair protein RadC